ncbi:peptide/nickel transport system ATP-binding protein [Bacillus thermophilus]|uniref:Peptide/nickel transport system ATP-binding protein n=1 Tax=Siminovitchia thermophila TaxID=1245522 RepID=A0ABS2R452_9BACI|nr:ABC transporter ATP-binding protein [Siminovitchia thermophila]MBM7713944.1 peptide/nickel transport system ATP-binding protein [Siminovitchia thermophila]ONK23829.1 peptide ABC transporter ATP-binding protein [Bacillus sp. VT-16-64]
MTALLEVKNLKTYFFVDKKCIRAVDGVDLFIKKGETVALVGESGSGKSITALSIMKLIPNPPGKIVEGQMIFNDVDLLPLPEKEMYHIRGNEISMIFQEPMTSLNPVLTIGEQIIDVLMYHKKLSKKGASRKAVELLKMVGFPRAREMVNEYPHSLSGGMRQRVMIAMAMSCDPKLLIADEPTATLDVTIQAQILDMMKELNKKFQTAILLITHDFGVVSEVADKVLIMYCGQIVEESPVDSLFHEPLHPYTIGLLNSIPVMDDDTGKLIPIPGNVPLPEHLPKGCRFAGRCPHAFDRCLTDSPDLKKIGTARSVRCFLYDVKGERDVENTG